MCDYDPPDAYVEKKRVARKAHRCCECRGGIQCGEAYVVCSGIWDGQPDSYKMCAQCDRLSELMKDHLMEPDDCRRPCFGDILSWAAEELHEATRFGPQSHDDAVILELRQLLAAGFARLEEYRRHVAGRKAAEMVAAL